MSKVFLISDLHLGHRNILKWARQEFRSVEDMHEVMVYQWNSFVKKRDTVIVLGDVAWDNQSLKIMGELNGTKKLVMGNHDKFKHGEYLKYFSSIHGALPYKNCILTHIPIHPAEFHRWRYNIHGHLHCESLDDPRYINVNVDQLDTYAPEEYEVLIRRRELSIAYG
jgi:calcineurin-like phosphoesterase family protein